MIAGTSTTLPFANLSEFLILRQAKHVQWKRAIDRFNQKVRKVNQAITFLEDSLEHTLAQQYAQRGVDGRQAPQPLRSRILKGLKKLIQPIEVPISSDIGTWFQ